MSASVTRAVEVLRRAGVAHTVLQYEAATPAEIRSSVRRSSGGRASDPPPASYGEAAAAALGLDPARVFKTLIARADDRLVAAIVPVDAELDLKRLAAAVGARRAAMADPAVAERASGYVLGGISPLGQRRRLPTVLDGSALAAPTIVVSGGRRGLQLELAPTDLARLVDAVVAAIARRD